MVVAAALTTPAVSDPKQTAWKRKVCNGTPTLRQAEKLELACKGEYDRIEPPTRTAGSVPWRTWR